MKEKQLPQDREAYRKWKEDIAKRGCTPMELAGLYERSGLAEYAQSLREIIKKMEAAL